MTNHIIETIELIGKEKLNAQVSLKLTSLGFDISEELVLNNLKRIMEKAKGNRMFITIDMEDFARCEKTIEIYKRLKRDRNEKNRFFICNR